ncbi:hypothetical protein [Enterococcus termitis]|uniref:Uncharacterized protein n=1 Tax=Enterococcus termitis TaxID=332950 RepID=A0A1E5GJP6_9ENTE|nr:hypothetical protein [Enterococcus termitis]OEG12946.1 hypothetical protein BCR25_05505 [Enterococcus termitis]
MKLSERMKQLSKKQKMTIATVAVLVVLGGSFGYKAYADSQTKKQVEQAQVLVDKQSEEIKDLQVEIKALFNGEKSDFLNKDVSEETLSPIREKLDKIEKNYASVVLPTKEVKTKDYSNYLSSCKESIMMIESMLVAQKDVNGLFGKAVIAGDTMTKDVAIKDDLKADTVKTVKDSYYNKESKSEWQKAINGLLDNADNQLKQIEKSKQTLEKVYKDNKVVNTDQKNYDSAKSEIDKIRNEKAKKELADKLAKVKQEIDSKAKAESEKKAQEQAVTESTTQKEQEQASQVAQNEPSTNGGAPQTATNNGAQEGYTPYVPEQGTGGAGASTGGGSNGSTGGGSAGGGTTGGGQTGGNQGGSTPTPPTEPSEPSTPSGPPAGWIASPYPIESQELWDWLWANGYSGYDSAGGYIRPY